ISLNHSVKDTLTKYNINFDSELIIRREIKKEGKSKCIINDTLITRNALEEIADHIIEVQGQFEDRGLLNTKTHLSLLDKFAQHDQLLNHTKIIFQEMTELKKQIQEAKFNYQKNNEDENWIRESLLTINQLDLKIGEEEELNKKRKILINSEKIIHSINESKEIIEKDQGLEDQIIRIIKVLDNIQSVASKNLIEAIDTIKRASTEIEELKSILNNENFEMNKGPENLEIIDDRLDELRTQSRKHNCDIDQLHEIKESLIIKLDKIDNNESFINNLNIQYQNIIIKYKVSCDLLSQSRVKSAVILSSKINNELPYLKLENAKLEILIEKLNDDEFTINGMDKITFLANTNSGMGMLPINKIASGGELSRFLLAIKVVIETGVQNRTIIFDEIDSGIGGAVANAVGIRLAKLGKAYQTIIVTHSPQVTSKGLHHYLIEKNTVNNITYSKITELFGNDRIEEIARMLSGDTVTVEAREAASKLLSDNVI
ncbi:MAG: DNA repair protein RecN, partial [Candidatus Puniceispirillales bacterium]